MLKFTFATNIASSNRVLVPITNNCLYREVDNALLHLGKCPGYFGNISIKTKLCVTLVYQTYLLKVSM